MGKALPIAVADSIDRMKETSSRVKRACRTINNERIQSGSILATVTDLCERYYDRLFEQLLPDIQKKVSDTYHQCKQILQAARSLHRSFKYALARQKAEEVLRRLKRAFGSLPVDHQIGWSEVMYI